MEENNWTIQDSDKLYNLNHWGNGFFAINEQGNLCVLPQQNTSGPCIEIPQIIEEMIKQNIQFPAVLRFHDILRSSVINLNKTFLKTIEEAGYRGKYIGVYPIKVNQMREVVEEIMDAGEKFNFGLEAGSKPEALAVLAQNNIPGALSIFNGYKDEDFLRLAILGRKLGRKVFVVVEKFSEIEKIISLSKEMGMEPLIGLRAKLSFKGSGKWAESTGEFAKFGLSPVELVQAVETLKKNGLLDSLKLFHFHIGSQIPDIRSFKEAIAEGARIYANLVKMGAPIEYFDAGGGLGVDYDGSRSNRHSSVNYSLKDYTGDLVYILKEVCDKEDVEHPNIVTESGRYLVAHHSCIIMNVFGKISHTETDFPLDKITGENSLVTNMRDLLSDLTPQNLQEVYNDAVMKKEEALTAFKLGVITLIDRAKIENIYWLILKKIAVLSKELEEVPRDIKSIRSNFFLKYLCNFSIFQSAIDSWAIGQVLPVMPLQRLNERPQAQCTLADITCDSDGKITKFYSQGKIRDALPVHDLVPGQDYYLGVFLTGAYQDIMGDMHNMFGRPNEVHIFSDDDDPTDFYIEEVIKGNTASDVLQTVQYSSYALANSVKRAIDKQVARGKIKPREGVQLADFYEDCLHSYTYLKT